MNKRDYIWEILNYIGVYTSSEVNENHRSLHKLRMRHLEQSLLC